LELPVSTLVSLTYKKVNNWGNGKRTQYDV